MKNKKSGQRISMVYANNLNVILLNYSLLFCDWDIDFIYLI